MTNNVYFHDNVMFILKTSPGLTVSVLVYSFSLRSLVFLSSVGRESWKVLYRSKSVMKSGSILKPRYIRFRVTSDRVISGLQC